MHLPLEEAVMRQSTIQRGHIYIEDAHISKAEHISGYCRMEERTHIYRKDTYVYIPLEEVWCMCHSRAKDLR